MNKKLAILGGPKAFDEKVNRFNGMGIEEVEAAKKVVESGLLSQFLGEWEDDNPIDFFGGKKIREFEDNWSDFFNVKHSISVNSCTSGLIAALGAIGINPGDEVIVCTWTMCATATSVLVWNAIPVFADIDKDTFTIDPVSIENNVTNKTKAIIVTNIFGQSVNFIKIKQIATKFNLKIIEDNAQAPGALYKEKYTGTIGDIGVFSLNYHKHIHTGEGGMCVTNNDEYAEKLQLIRNHGEAVVKGKGVENIENIIGFNFRMGEIEAAIGIEQLKKLPFIINEKVEIADCLSSGLSDLPGIQTPKIGDHCTHVYYAYPITVQEDLDRNAIYKALVAEGVPYLAKAFSLAHLLPMYQQKIAYGKSGYPWKVGKEISDISYNYGICPIAEGAIEKTYMNFGIGLVQMDKLKVKKMLDAFNKVWDAYNL
jgi:perosamine synthetase